MAVPYSIKRAQVNVGVAATDTVVVAAVAGKRLRILSLIINGDAAAGTIVLNTKPAGAGVAISPVFDVVAGSCIPLPVNEYGWFESVAGQGLSASTTGAGGASLSVIYIED